MYLEPSHLESCYKVNTVVVDLKERKPRCSYKKPGHRCSKLTICRDGHSALNYVGGIASTWPFKATILKGNTCFNILSLQIPVTFLRVLPH
jgi:hypothetical protein